MIKNFTLLLCFFTCLTSAISQHVVKGTARDENGKTLAGVNVYIKDAYDGAITDSTGRFSFPTSSSGPVYIVGSFIGYKSAEQYTDINSAEVNVELKLVEEISELNAVVITAGSFEASDKKRATVLSLLDIVTTAGADADISATLQTVPGVQKVGEQEGLFVRGGSAEEAKIIIDGAVVNNFFYTSIPGIASRGRFSPFLFSGTAFTSGGYSALYGQALSAVLNLESVDLPFRSEVQAGISPLFASVGFQKVDKEKTQSFGASYSYANLGLYMKIIPQRFDVSKAPIGHDGDFNYRFKTRKNGIFKFYTTYSFGKQGIRQASLDSVGLKNGYRIDNANLYFNTSFKQSLGKNWKYMAVASFSFNKDDIDVQLVNNENQQLFNTGINSLDNINFNNQATQQMLQFRSIFERKFDGLNALRFGGEVWYNKDKANIKSNFFTGNTSIEDTYGAVFAETDYYLSKNLAFRPGVRLEYSDLIGRANIAPRVSLSYKIAPQMQLTADYGIFYQTPERKYLLFEKDFDFQRADHYILTYQWLTKDYTFRIQAYDKEYLSLVKTDNSNLAAISTNGNGYARGIEFFWRDKKTFKGFNYWLSYSFIDTERDYLNYPVSATPTFAAKHSGSVVLKKFWVSKMIGVNWSYTVTSGRPYFNPNLPSADFLSDRTRMYQSHNVSVNWITSILKSNAVVVFSLNNVFNQKQIFGYNYSNRLLDENNLLLSKAIQPPAAQSIFLGVFMSWGVDRTLDNINNNL